MSNRKHRDNQEICARKVRELAQSGVNKHCFECSQPGVTYTDITAGCFVCTSCSGMLRGLNPPHRVKSISMTTFSQQEVEFLQNHGNEVGRRTWLCVFDPKTDGCSDMKDSQKFKEFLQDKYEKKKWHFSKSKNRRDVEGPWSPGVQAALPPHGPLTSHAPSHNLAPNARSTRPLSQSQLPSWDRAPAISPADMRTDVLTARPSRTQSFRDPHLKDPGVGGIERQRPGSLSSALGAQSHVPSFPALPRPSGRTVSASGASGPFRAFPKSLSVDFGGLTHPHQSALPHSRSQQQAGSVGTATMPPPRVGSSNPQDRYAAVSHLDNCFTDTPPVAVFYGPLENACSQLHRVARRSTAPSSAAGPRPAQLLPAPPVSIQRPAPKPLQISPTHSAPARLPSSPAPSPPVTPSATRPEGTPARLSPRPPQCFPRIPRMHFTPSRPATRRPTVSPPSPRPTLSPKSPGRCR
ncbi:arf-GAP domain and FG repeat-containing protein 2 isoform X4 [Gasterosteus aculeatus]